MKTNDSILVGVAIGEAYERQADVMVQSFLQFHGGWDVKIYGGLEINEILPQRFLMSNPFNKCEIGRWCAVLDALRQGYKTVLYCDNDIHFYGKYEPLGHGLVLFPHYVTDKAKQSAAHWLLKDGVPNLGMFEANGEDGSRICEFVIGEVTSNPVQFCHNGNQLWLQNLASCLPSIGHDVVYNNSPSHNVAHWNLAHEDRFVEQILDGYDDVEVVCDDTAYPLLTFHFSAKGINRLPNYGEAVAKLRDRYLKKISCHNSTL